MSLSELETRDIAVLGAGREGRSVLRWLGRRYPQQRVTVYAEAPPGREFLADPAMRRHALVIGPLHAATLASHELLVRSPGISVYREELQAAKRAGARITSASSLWFAAHPKARTLCITGTKGKSTTAALAARLLRACGATVELAGNIGQPLLDCAGAEPDWWVIELSSYQLADLEARPSIAVLLNLSDEHLDWHGGAENYRRDKLRLARLAAGHPVVAAYTCPGLRPALTGTEHLSWFDHPDGWHLRDGALVHGRGRPVTGLPECLRAAHNLRNLAAALTALGCAGFDLSGQAQELHEALAGFSGLPHRQQPLGARDGLAWVNDSLATTPVATLAALRALAGQSVTLLVGGLDRGVDWAEAIVAMRESPPRCVVALPDSGPKILAAMRSGGLEPVGGLHEAPDLDAAVACARRLSRPGDVVLLSPGAPSFPHFRDYAERGERFAELAGFPPPGDAPG